MNISTLAEFQIRRGYSDNFFLFLNENIYMYCNTSLYVLTEYSFIIPVTHSHEEYQLVINLNYSQMKNIVRVHII